MKYFIQLNIDVEFQEEAQQLLDFLEKFEGKLCIPILSTYDEEDK